MHNTCLPSNRLRCDDPAGTAAASCCSADTPSSPRSAIPTPPPLSEWRKPTRAESNRRSVAERLASYLALDPVTDCWLWQGQKGGNGYGYLKANGKSEISHRLAYEIANGPIPDKRVVRHRCDTPLCCNPDHLELGTQSDNMRDMVVRGRSRRGERGGSAKLSDKDALLVFGFAIAGVPRKEIANALGVSGATVTDILSRRSRSASMDAQFRRIADAGSGLVTAAAAHGA